MQNDEKRLAGEKAAEFVTDGMIVGLGTGSTVAYTIRKLGEMVSQGLRIQGVATSEASEALARSLGIPLLSVDDAPAIDLTIDGADEIDRAFDGIKGGGGALLREKIVALASRQVIWVVDAGKMVPRLGRFPLPVEVVPFGCGRLQRHLRAEGLRPELRIREGQPFVTDGGHYILDLHLEAIADARALGSRLKALTGVVDHGLFLAIVDRVVVGRGTAVEVLDVARPGKTAAEAETRKEVR